MPQDCKVGVSLFEKLDAVAIYNLIRGCKLLVGHNVDFDVKMLFDQFAMAGAYDLSNKSNWPVQVCTQELAANYSFEEKRSSLRTCWSRTFGKSFEQHLASLAQPISGENEYR